jgi:transposase
MADKRQALRRARLLNPKAAAVHAPLFRRVPFFDPDDKLQVKYEMLRSHAVDALPIRHAAPQFGYTRQGFYQVQQAFRDAGMAGLLDKKRGRKGPVKCTPDVVAFVVREKHAHPDCSGRDLAERLRAQRGLEVHRRTIEKIVAGLARPRRKKKLSRPP